jgi:predicted phosphodiesterase
MNSSCGTFLLFVSGCIPSQSRPNRRSSVAALRPGPDQAGSLVERGEKVERNRKGSLLMRVAVLADIHGNLPALNAVLDEIDAAAVDAIVLNGDIATGPMPAETLDRLAELGKKAIWVRGNADRELVAAYAGALNPDLPEAAPAPPSTAHPGWTRDIGTCSPIWHCRSPSTSPGWGRCGSATPPRAAIPRSCSSTHRSSATERPSPTLMSRRSCSATHMPFDRLAERRRFVNPGSVGMPYGARAALWALLGPDVALRRTAYDADVAAETFRSAAPGYPGLAEFIDENVLTVPSDAQALAIFSRWRKA